MKDVCQLKIGTLQKNSVFYRACDSGQSSSAVGIGPANNPKAWADSIYLGNAKTALGYLATDDSATTGKPTKRILQKVTLKQDIQMIESNCCCFWKNSWRKVLGEIILALTAEGLMPHGLIDCYGGAENVPFMRLLGDRRYGFRDCCYHYGRDHDNDEWETIIPYPLVTEGYLDCKEAEFKKISYGTYELVGEDCSNGIFTYHTTLNVEHEV